MEKHTEQLQSTLSDCTKMRIATGISTARRIDPTTQPMGKFTYAWAMSLGTENTGTAWDDFTIENLTSEHAKLGFSKNSDGWRITASSQTGSAGFMYVSSNPDAGFLYRVPGAAVSNDPEFGDNESTPKAGIPAANRYFGMVITFATGSDFIPGNSDLKVNLYVGTGTNGTTTPPFGDFGKIGPASSTTAAQRVAYVNGLKVTEDDGTLIYANRTYMGFLNDGTASTEKGIPLTLVWDLNRDSTWSGGDVTSDLVGRYLRLSPISNLSGLTLDFTLHGFFWSNSDPTRMKFNSSDLPISLTRATGKD